MEIERKFLADPSGLDLSKYRKKEMSQGYVSTDPVIRIRRSNEDYILTVKNGGLLVREEFETPLTAEQYAALSEKVEGIFLSKTRYLIPIRCDAAGVREVTDENPGGKDRRMIAETSGGPGRGTEDSVGKAYTIELDIFHGALDGLIYAEVEFPTVEEAEQFTPPSWFLREVTKDGSYTNAALSRMTPEELQAFLNRL